jgi:predicted RNA methylase
MFYDSLIEEHLPWLNDAGRNSFYQKIITENCKDKVCIDVGAGSGILTDYALEAGAKKIYCVEIRKVRANYLKEKYKNKNVVVIEDDFLNTRIPDAEVIFLEQIGCQFNNNFSIKKFMSHIKKYSPCAEMLPNRYKIKAYMFDGVIDAKPKFLIDSKYLPKNFYKECQSQLRIKPTEILSVYEINKKNADEDIEFSLDLSHYKDCTIFLDEEVYFNDLRCEYENTYRDWEMKPLKILIQGARKTLNFKWVVDKFIYS